MDDAKVAANEELRRIQKELGVAGERLPFLCECRDPACRSIVLLSTSDYALARVDGARCIVIEGHPFTGSPVEVRDGYAIVQEG